MVTRMLFDVKRLRTMGLILLTILFSCICVIKPSLLVLALAGSAMVYLVTSLRTALVVLLATSTFSGVTVQFSNPLLRPEVLFVLVALGAFLYALLRKSGRIYLSSEMVLFSVFVVYTYIVSKNESPVFEASFHGIVQLAIAFIGFVVMYQARDMSKEKLLAFVKWVAVISTVQSAYGLISFAVYRFSSINIGGLMFGQYGESVTVKGTLLEANLFGSFVGMGLILSIGLLAAGMIQRKKLWYLAIVLQFAGLVFSWTRSAWIGFVVVGLIFALYNFRKVLNKKTFVSLFLSGLFFIAPLFYLVQSQFDSGTKGMFVSKLTHLFDGESGTGLYRIKQYNLALQDLKGHEIFGRGYFSIKVYGEKEWISNLFLFIYHDTGLIGLFLFLLIFLAILVKGMSGIKRTKDPQIKIILTALLCGFGLYLIAFNFTPGHTLSMFWVYLGLIGAIASKCKAEGE